MFPLYVQVEFGERLCGIAEDESFIIERYGVDIISDGKYSDYLFEEVMKKRSSKDPDPVRRRKLQDRRPRNLGGILPHGTFYYNAVRI